MIRVTYEICYNAAKSCDTLSDFRTKYYSYYIKCSKLNWLKDFTWLKPFMYTWTKENTYKEALKYEYLGDFMRSVSGAYKAARKNGWLKDYTWLKKKVYKADEKTWCVYSYEFPNNYVYIGLTVDIKRRHIDHKCRVNKDNLAKYCKANNLVLPDYIVKYENLNSTDALFYEDTVKQEYILNNWNIINKGSTGIGSSSLGNAIVKWTKESIYEVAKLCISRKDLKIKYPRAYRIALDNNWIDDFTWFKTRAELLYYLDYKIFLFDDNYNLVGSYFNKALLFKSLNLHLSNKRYLNKALLNHIKAFNFYWSYTDIYPVEFRK